MKIIIAGSCALESRAQLQELVASLKKMGIGYLRASLWKPRTRPGWEGVGFDYLPILFEETTAHGIEPATEIGCSEHARTVVNYIEREHITSKLILWLGARNQNHNEQHEIGKILSEVSNITLMVKNQMWEDERHWMGIMEHILSGGFPAERLWVCHRGFAPGRVDNPDNLRNIPDFEMAMRIKEKTKFPMILDPSHIGGSRENVINIFKISLDYDFDGYMIEVHNNPSEAKTDAEQQLTPDQLRELMQMLQDSSEKITSQI